MALYRYQDVRELVPAVVVMVRHLDADLEQVIAAAVQRKHLEHADMLRTLVKERLEKNA